MYGYGLDLNSSIGSVLNLLPDILRCTYLSVCMRATVWCGGRRTPLQEPVSAMDLWDDSGCQAGQWSPLPTEHSRWPLMSPFCSSWQVGLSWEAVGSLGSRGLPDGRSPTGPGLWRSQLGSCFTTSVGAHHVLPVPGTALLQEPFSAMMAERFWNHEPK